MTTTVPDAALLAELQAAAIEVELCDQSGATIGFFVPPDKRRMLHDLAFAAFDDDPEALEASRREPGGMTTAEATAHIARLVDDHKRKNP